MAIDSIGAYICGITGTLMASVTERRDRAPAKNGSHVCLHHLTFFSRHFPKKFKPRFARLTYVHDMLAGKSVELLREVMPQVSRVAILWNPNHADPEFRETQKAARTLGVQLQSLEVREAKDFDIAFQDALRERCEAL